ncbi:MAG: DUF493 domain-containing protein [Pseudomonas sp.]|uniref:DUF493 domain-containing protein n=1 Tax=Pseudomonas sp. TaxID=306 RepID=UPI003392F363
MTDVQNVTIELPCEAYPIKVIGDAGEGFAELVIATVRPHAPGLDPSTMVLRDSRNGRYQTVQLLITATSIEQLQDINSALRATGRVHMVL